ncbi:MAG TPA: hypothetical protein VMN57_03770 [Anaerolineales bacterium]|nr:hypothetical protein [Anaerolineales bacterium]
MMLENPHRQFKIGTALLWLGVLVWAPYFAQQFAGENPSMMAYLPLHLAGVIGGARLRTSARRKLGIPKKKRTGLKKFAHWVAMAGLLVWLPYYTLKLLGRPVPLNPYLTLHLIGVFGGIGLMVVAGVLDRFQNNSNGELDEPGHTTQANDE